MPERNATARKRSTLPGPLSPPHWATLHFALGNEPHDQGRNRQTLSRRRPRSVAKSPRQLHQRLELRAKAEDPQRPHTLRVHLQTMDNRTRKVHPKADPSNAGTEDLDRPIAELSNTATRATDVVIPINVRSPLILPVFAPVTSMAAGVKVIASTWASQTSAAMKCANRPARFDVPGLAIRLGLGIQRFLSVIP